MLLSGGCVRINCDAAGERVLHGVIETGIGLSGVGICKAACDRKMDDRRWIGGIRALTPLSLRVTQNSL